MFYQPVYLLYFNYLNFLYHTVAEKHSLTNYARTAQHVSDDQGTPQTGTNDCATNAGAVPQGYFSCLVRVGDASDTIAPGQLGRVAVIGGSEKYVKSVCTLLVERIPATDPTSSYTGAPYFSAMASARLGT